MGNKRFKDPIYGYVEIEEELVTQVVDTAVFQRLRDIIQTSYAPLYSSATHNRFVHSIGVYHLGKMAAESFRNSISNKSLHIFQDINQYIKIFKLACLLHDVGHAPFSHTGEFFYLYNGERTKLHEQIIDLTNDTVLLKEIEDNSYKAAPHELMSVIVSLREFSDMIPDVMKAFFARCITGYKYTHNMDADKSCMNCLIELLNSKVIDVDKIDYLIRDSYVTGFDTVSIDYVRLLRSIYIDENQRHYKICFDKSAVSVLENVVYAHFQGEEGNLAIIENEFMELQKHLNSLGLPFVINENALKASRAEIKKIQRKMKGTVGEELERLKATLAANNVHIKWIKVFEKFAKKNKDELDFEFLIIFANTQKQTYH